MPLPPVHGLAALSPYFKNKARLDPLALVVSATFIDLEPLYYILVGQPLDHQMLHGYALALTVYPVAIALGVYAAEKFLQTPLQSIYQALRLNASRVRFSFVTVYLCCLAGAFSHIFLDMFTHQAMPYVFYPFLTGNPIYLGDASGIVEAVAIALSIYSLFAWLQGTKALNPQNSKLET